MLEQHSFGYSIEVEWWNHSYDFKLCMKFDLSVAEINWFIHRGPLWVIETLPCFIIWIETLSCVIKGDRLSMIILYIIARIIIYIRLRFLSLCNQMETLKVWARLNRRDGKGSRSGVGGWEAKQHAGCRVGGHARGASELLKSALSLLYQRTALSPNRSHMQSAMHSGQ